MTYQTQIDHAACQKACRAKSDDSLRYMIQDCREAMEAMPHGHKAGYYADEIHYASMELQRRQGR